MPISSARLTVGKTYRIEFVSDAATPGPSLLQLGWIPRSGMPVPPAPVTLMAGPGDGDSDQGTVPSSYALFLQWDVPDDKSSKVTVRVLQEGQTQVEEVETDDGDLTVIVEAAS
jgi:hypothetical protein